MTDSDYILLNGVETAKALGIHIRLVYKLFDEGKLLDNQKTGHARKFKVPKDQIKTSTEAEEEKISSYDLKEQHLQVRIKKEEQMLYENKLMLADKIADVFINIYHLPRIMKLTEIVRKYNENPKELIEQWNKQIELGATENLRELQDELQKLTLD